MYSMACGFIFLLFSDKRNNYFSHVHQKAQKFTFVISGHVEMLVSQDITYIITNMWSCICDV